MFYANNWGNQINNFESVNGYSPFELNIKDLNKREYNEYMDLLRQHNETHLTESSDIIHHHATKKIIKKYA